MTIIMVISPETIYRANNIIFRHVSNHHHVYQIAVSVKMFEESERRSSSYKKSYDK